MRFFLLLIVVAVIPHLCEGQPAPGLPAATAMGPHEIPRTHHAFQNVDVNGSNVLHVAVMAGQLGVVQLAFTRQLADVADAGDRLPLVLAALSNRTDIITALRAAGADMLGRDAQQRTILHRAFQDGQQPQLAEALGRIATNAELAAIDHVGRTALHYAAEIDHPSIRAILRHVRILPDHHGNTPQHLAARMGHADVISYILRVYPVVNGVNSAGYSPLHLAARHNHHVVVARLLENGADPHVRIRNGFTPLHLAVSRRHRAVVQVLVRDFTVAVNGANAVDNSSRTPLHHAVQNGGDATIVQLLIDAGSNTMARDSFGLTTLHEGARGGNLQIMEVLLGSGAVEMVEDIFGHYPIAYAIHNRHVAVVKLLEEAGARL